MKNNFGEILEEKLKKLKIRQNTLRIGINVSQTLVSHWINNRKEITPARARDIEIFTEGLIKRDELCDDILMTKEEYMQWSK